MPIQVSLSDIATHPEAVSGLSDEDRTRLMAQAAGLIVLLSVDGRKSDTPKLLTIEEAAKILSISNSAMYRRVVSGKIPAVRDGRIIRLREADLRRWMESA